MNRSTSLVLVIGTCIVLLCGCLVGLPLFALGQWNTELAACGIALDPHAPAAEAGDWNSTQVGHGQAIAAAGRQRGLPPRAVVIALATAMQESQLRNLANPSVPQSLELDHDGIGHDHDSIGLFQQRPSAGWGTVAQLMDPTYAAGVFYDRLVTVPDWDQMRITEAAQAVQRSAFPEAYQKWQPAAEQLAAHLYGVPTIEVIGGGAPDAPCGLAGFGPIIVGPQGWVQPLNAPVTSPFGPRGGRLHAGVDLSHGNVRGQPIRAAADGVVATVACNSSIGTCDRDGSPHIQGCGWYVDIRHSGNIVTRYCHMLHRPPVEVGQRVRAGDVIGLVGSSGNSSGPHLHFEVHLNAVGTAVDPEVWMNSKGAPLGQLP